MREPVQDVLNSTHGNINDRAFFIIRYLIVCRISNKKHGKQRQYIHEKTDGFEKNDVTILFGT